MLCKEIPVMSFVTVRKLIGPGPGAYAPEKHYYPPSRTTPEYSIGRKLKGRKHDGLYNPAPNAYSLPSRIGIAHPDLKKAPAYFITFRDKKGISDLFYLNTIYVLVVYCCVICVTSNTCWFCTCIRKCKNTVSYSTPIFIFIYLYCSLESNCILCLQEALLMITVRPRGQLRTLYQTRIRLKLLLQR